MDKISDDSKDNDKGVILEDDSNDNKNDNNEKNIKGNLFFTDEINKEINNEKLIDVKDEKKEINMIIHEINP